MTQPNQNDEQELPPVVVSGESRISINWNMIDKFGVQFQITMREGMTAKDVGHLLSERSKLIAGLLENGYSVRGETAATPLPKPVVAVATTPAPVTSPTNAPSSPAPSSSATQTATGKVTQEMIISRIDVTPVPDGKIKVQFFEPNHKYPDIYATRGVDEFAAVMKAATGLDWQPSHFQVAGKHEGLALKVGYTLSDKLNSKNNPYKDIQYIKG